MTVLRTVVLFLAPALVLNAVGVLAGLIGVQS